MDAAVINGGSIRASIPQGGITKKMIRTVLPFGNTLSIVKITGAELLEALEASTYCTPSPMGSFPQVFGMAFSVDTDAAYDSGAEYPNTYYHAPESIQRVNIDSIGEEPLTRTRSIPLPPTTSWRRRRLLLCLPDCQCPL